MDITNPAESGFDHMYGFMRGPSWGKAIFHPAGKLSRPIGQPPVPADTESPGTPNTAGPLKPWGPRLLSSSRCRGGAGGGSQKHPP